MARKPSKKMIKPPVRIRHKQDDKQRLSTAESGNGSLYNEVLRLRSEINEVQGSKEHAERQLDNMTQCKNRVLGSLERLYIRTSEVVQTLNLLQNLTPIERIALHAALGSQFGDYAEPFKLK